MFADPHCVRKGRDTVLPFCLMLMDVLEDNKKGLQLSGASPSYYLLPWKPRKTKDGISFELLYGLHLPNLTFVH